MKINGFPVIEMQRINDSANGFWFSLLIKHHRLGPQHGIEAVTYTCIEGQPVIYLEVIAEENSSLKGLFLTQVHRAADGCFPIGFHHPAVEPVPYKAGPEFYFVPKGGYPLKLGQKFIVVQVVFMIVGLGYLTLIYISKFIKGCGPG